MLRAPCRRADGHGRSRYSLDRMLFTTAATARLEGHQERQRRQGLLRDGPDVPQREYNKWYLDMMKKKVDPKKPEGMLQAKRMCIYNCERNQRGLPCVLKEVDDGTLVATCGIVHTQCGDERAEKRFFREDPEKSLAGVRAEEDVHEKSKELVRPITGAEIGRPDLDDLLCADADEDADEANWDPLRKANMRLNQCTVWFNCVQDRRPGAFYLTTDEILTARRALRAVCIRWAQRGGDANVAHSASPIFWAIGLALEMVARRVDGYTVPTPHMQGIVSLEGLHAYLEPRKGEAFWTDESDLCKTKVWAKGLRDAQRATERIKRRYARFDPLGDASARRNKMATLSQLLGQSGFFKDHERDVLHADIRALRAALVRAPLPWSQEEPTGTLIGVEPARFGLNTMYSKGAANVARSAEVGVAAMGARTGSTNTETETGTEAWARSSSAASDAVSEVRVRGRGRVELTRAQVSRARGRTQAGPWQRCPFPCHTPCVPTAAVPSVARADRTRTTPIRTWRRQSRLARLRRPARAARRGLARRLPQPTLMATHVAPPPR